MKINSHFCDLPHNYLFTEVVSRSEAYVASHPDERPLLRLGVGDVRGPLAPVVIDAMTAAVRDQADPATFHGYGLEQGEKWMRRSVADFDYRRRGMDIDEDEIFISDGAGTTLGDLSDIFDEDNLVAVQDPVYPAYVDTNIMAGRRIITLPCNPANHFCPQLPQETPDIIYLCSPNNPTGTALNTAQLTTWVRYAHSHHSVIIFDAAYEAFIREPDIPHSIYEIPGAKEVAIEIRSFSKTAGFTGVRCGYTVVPKNLMSISDNGKQVSLNALWLRRQCTKYNGTSYISMRGAQAVLTEQGRCQTMMQIDGYIRNARAIRDALTSLGLEAYGGINAPYVWCRVPGHDAWESFDILLHRCQVVCTPGIGFGQQGRDFIRFSGFGTLDDTQQAIFRIKNTDWLA